MRVLLDMNIPLRYTDLLAEKGVQSLRWSDIGAPDATDAEIMAYARENNFIVLYCNIFTIFMGVKWCEVQRLL